MVHVTVCAMKGVREMDAAECLSSRDNEVELMPTFGSGVSPGEPVQRLSLEKGVGDAKLVITAQL